MRHVVFAVGAFAILSLGASDVWAQRYYRQHYAFQKFCDETIANNMWPEQYLGRDRQAVRAPFGVMIDKGWQLQNTLGDYHFEAETQQLTRAGELHLRWIVTQAPENRRTVFVLRGHNDAATAVRIDTVQQTVAQLHPKGALPAVVQTNAVPPTSPADYQDDISQKAAKVRPAPALPAATSGSGGGSGGSSGGGSGS
jgi:hypothetical protein